MGDRIVIINYGMGNVGSIGNMFRKIGVESALSSEPQEIRAAKKLVLPGVGAFDRGMKNLQDGGLVPVLNEAVLDRKIPILGICLGMQLLSRRSEEGQLPGLGWIPADTVRFHFPPSSEKPPAVPHMGWKAVTFRPDSRLFRNWDGEARFYFVHSYHVVCDRKELVSATASYGCDFAASFEQDHIFGTQFHPEKSHRYGMQVLKNFSEL